jgi:outer membrane protein
MVVFTLAVILSVAPHVLVQAQNPDPPGVVPASVASPNFLSRPPFPNVLLPYAPISMPAPRMNNSALLHALIHDGKLEISLSDALALALENNLDIEVTRYVLVDAQTDLLRARGGGSTQGFNGVTQTGSTTGASATGTVSGTTSQAGASTQVGASASGASSSNTACCDPYVGFNFEWDRITEPYNYTGLVGAPIITNQTTSLSSFYSQGFFTGTSYTVGLEGYRQSTTAPDSLLDPEVPGEMVIQLNQPLLKGFGYRANAVGLRVAQNGVKLADSVFRQQVITTATQVANYYYDLTNYYQYLVVARQGLTDAEQQEKDVKKESELGVIAKFDLVRAQRETALRRQVEAQVETAYRQQEELLKTAVSRQNADPELSAVDVVPTEDFPQPMPNDIPPLDDALHLGLANREELTQDQLNLRDQNLVVKADRNALLPSLNFFADYLPEGLTGNSVIYTCPASAPLTNGECVPAVGAPFSPVATGTHYSGVFQTLTQVFHGRFPEYNYGINLQIPIRNRVAQATAARALANQRQMEAQAQRDRNLVVQDVRTAEANVSEARKAIEVSHQYTTLAQQELDGYKQMFKLGKVDYFFVTEAEDELIQAQGSELQARDNYAKALAQFGEATATTLDRYHISMNDARQGHVSHLDPAPAQSQGTH